MSETMQIKTKQRVNDHGEVFTDHKEVNAMLDLVNQETENINSRFLEPACGTGNFLVEILKRRLSFLERKYKKNQNDYERYSITALFNIYGIELLDDNARTCRDRLFGIFTHHYVRVAKNPRPEYLKTGEFVISRNILCGNALTLKNDNEKPIVFTEWAFVNPRQVKRRDFVFEEMIPRDSHELFAAHLISDEGKLVFISEPVKEYPLTHFLNLADGDNK